MDPRWCTLDGASSVKGHVRTRQTHPSSREQRNGSSWSCQHSSWQQNLPTRRRLFEETVRNFKHGSAGTQGPWTSRRWTLDKAVERYSDFLFFDGCGFWESRTLLHGLAFVLNVSFKLVTLMERSKRALEGWARKRPAQSRDPVPFEVVCLSSLQLLDAPNLDKVHLTVF